MIAIIDYGLGNLRSVSAAIDYLGYSWCITRDRSEICNSNKLILPGVGSYGDGIKRIREYGLDDVLTELVINQKVPILGICLGFQLMGKSSTEFGLHTGLSWLDADTVELRSEDECRIPHVGWNEHKQTRPSRLFANIPEDALFYYVHSYHMVCANRGDVAAICQHSEKFTSAIERQNIFGTQFHPEKSQHWGLHLLKNFLET
jgi:glutamine amidotransferase